MACIKRNETMKTVLGAGIASLALGLAALTTVPAVAADLNYDHKYSLKDTYVPPIASGYCYFKAGLGYSWSEEPTVSWGLTTFANADLGNAWLGQAGLGCSQGDRGWRAELEFAYRGKKKFDAEITTTPNNPPNPGDPAHTSIQSSTLMVNAYYNLGNWHNVVPYVGAGIGFAYNRMSNVYFTNSPFFNEVIGKDTLTLAWALMAGAEVKVSDRWSLDFGYRFIDFGLAESDHGDTGNNWNPRFRLDDLRSHEFLVSARYKFCATCR